ncbi:hypothetical protein ACFS6H_20195 [Terrimonas rubra]|uniref:Uncharacterized protein n=1 Tax=Terrimonas rubra TaxID=1035890 RepID=A0ABW6AD01_9BACT
MYPTKYSISEQVMSLLKGGNPSVSSSIDIREVMVAINQAINKLLKVEYYSTHLASGEEIAINGQIIATYDNIPVKSTCGKAEITLPVMPVKLLKNQGLWHISKQDDHWNPFIPIPNGMGAMLQGEPILSDLLGQVGYEQFGLKVVFKTDITLDGINEVMVKLVVSDIEKLEDTDPLPIPADMEQDVVVTVFQILGGQLKPLNPNDNTQEKQ